MDLEKLKLIKEDVLKEELIPKKQSSDFCGLYVDGTGKLTFELADAPFHAFKAYSQYDYPVYLFVSITNDDKEIKKILQKYPNTKVYSIPALKNPIEYNQWMFNTPWFFLESPSTITFQEDGFLIQKGWEEFVTKGDYDFIGAIWKSDIRLLSDCFNYPATRFANGGMSYRKVNKMRQIIDIVNKNGGQEKVFKGIEIDGELKHTHWGLAEDIMFTWIGFGAGLLKTITKEECDKFSHEPIEFSLYMDKDNPNRPIAFHKIDQ